jgi:hypothetical protein
MGESQMDVKKPPRFPEVALFNYFKKISVSYTSKPQA